MTPCHTLADLRDFAQSAGSKRIVPASTLYLLRLIAAGDEGLRFKEFSEVEQFSFRRRWLSSIRREGDRIFALPALSDALLIRDPSHASSIHRVMSALVDQQLRTFEVGVLIWASARGGIQRDDLPGLPWTSKAHSNRRARILRLAAKGFLATTNHKGACANPTGSTGLIRDSLTPKGRTLLLGLWGKFAPKADTVRTSSASRPIAA